MGTQVLDRPIPTVRKKTATMRRLYLHSSYLPFLWVEPPRIPSGHKWCFFKLFFQLILELRNQSHTEVKRRPALVNTDAEASLICSACLSHMRLTCFSTCIMNCRKENLKGLPVRLKLTNYSKLFPTQRKIFQINANPMF